MSQRALSPITRFGILLLSSVLFCISSKDADATDLSGRTVEVYNTGGIGLKAWTSTCTGTYVNKADGTRGVVVSTSSSLCGGYNRWKIKWTGDATERWSAEDYLLVVPPDLTVSGAVTVSPSSPAVGDTITVGCIIANVGQGNAIPSGTKLLLLRLSPFDIVLTEDGVETDKVDAGTSVLFTYNGITLPSNLSPGIYQISVEVDSYNATGQVNFANDVKKSAEFTISASHYTVTATAGAGGTIYPIGDQSVNANGSISFTASPNSTNVVDQWLVGGVVQQTGGTSFTLSPVTANKTVNVTFKLKSYSLTVDAVGADVTITPQLSTYPHGGFVTVKLSPQAGRVFVQWNGTIQSLDQTLTFPMTGDVSLTAILRSLAPPTTVQTAHTTPATSFDLSYPTTDGYIYVLEFSDNGRHWRPLTVTTGHDASEAIHHLSTTSGSQGYYRVRQTAYYYLDQGFLTFPLPNGKSTTFRVTSIFDHHGNSSLVKDGAIVTYKGQMATVDKYARGLRTQSSQVLEPMNSIQGDPDYFGNFFLAAYGKDSSTSNFDLPINYHDDFSSGGKGLLYYDGHPGYDYGCPKDTEIRAAAKGTLMPDRSGGAANQIAIQHLNGYQTFYVHCESWVGSILTAKNNNEAIDLEAGQLIGYVGDKGAAPGQYHLHFEVHRRSADQGDYVLVDPYGYFAEDGSLIDPPLWINGE